MVTAFRRGKYFYILHVFLDYDKNGVIEKEDVDNLITRMCQYRGWKVGDEKHKKTQDTLCKIWDGLSKQVDLDGDGKITADEWVLTWDAYAKDPSQVQEWQELLERFVFDFEDFNDDGEINAEELAEAYAQFGVSKDKTKSSFEILSQGKESINWDDFRKLWMEYFCSDDPDAVGNYLCGKLSHCTR